MLLLRPADHVPPHLLPDVEILRAVVVPPLGVDLHDAVEVAEEEADVGSVDDRASAGGVDLGVCALENETVLVIVVRVQQQGAGDAGGVGESPFTEYRLVSSILLLGLGDPLSIIQCSGPSAGFFTFKRQFVVGCILLRVGKLVAP